MPGNPPETLQTLIRELPRFGRRRAVGLRRDLGLRWWSYGRLHQESMRAASWLEHLGVRPGDAVLIRAPNCPEWVAALFGAWWRGAAVVPLDADAPADFLCRVARDVDARVLLIAGADGPVQTEVPTFDLFALHEWDAPATTPANVPVTPEDPAVIFYTSGTTSAPRGVVLTHGNLAAQTKRFRAWALLARLIPARMLVIAPLSHSQGLLLGCLIPLRLGLAAIQTHSSHPGHVIRTIRDNRVTILSTVPRALQKLSVAFLKRRYFRSRYTLEEKLRSAPLWILRRHYAFRALHAHVGYRFWLVFVGGAPLPASEEDFWWDTGCLLIQGYGLTETAAIVSVNAPLFGAFRSVGRPLPQQEVRLAEDGEILVRGPTVMPGYHEDQEADAQAFTDGFLRTGDLGRFDRKNRLYIVGRKKDLIVTGEGFNVDVGDVERALCQEPGVRDAVALGIEHDGDTSVHAVLLLEPGTDPAEAVRAANDRLHSHQRIRGWTVWPELDFPRSPLMKVKRGDVQERVLETLAQPAHGLAPADGCASLDEALRIPDRTQRLRQIARYVVREPGSRCAEETAGLVRDLGLSSLDIVELLTLLEQESGAILDDTVVDEDATLGELRSMALRPPQQTESRARALRNPPRWAEWPALTLVRRVMNPAVLGGWCKLRARLEVVTAPALESLEGPVILAGIGHEHAFDVLLIYQALPRRLRRKVAVVASRWVFSHYLDPEPDVPWVRRAVTGLGFNLLAPLFFPLALTPHFGTTREGLLEACRLIDRGFSPIVFEGQGIAWMASQTGAPIVPTRLEGNRDIDFLPRLSRERVSVVFEAPIRATPNIPEERIMDELEALFPE